MDNTSPTPEEVQPINTPTLETVQMSFSEAIQKILEGSKATKLEWANEQIYGFLNNGMLQLHNITREKQDDNWAVSEADMQGTDWVILA